MIIYEKNSNGKITASTILPAGNTINMSTKLEIFYHPDNDVDGFKQKLLVNKRAYIKLHYIGGESSIRIWNANNFKESSSIDNNLRSGCLKDWGKKGICKAELSASQDDF